MAKLEVTLKDDQGKIISQLPVIELELGKSRLDEIETAVEEMRKNLRERYKST